MSNPGTWALGIDVGNAKIKLFALHESGDTRNLSTALPWTGRSPYDRGAEFEKGIHSALSAILPRYSEPPTFAVAVMSNGYSYSTHEQAALHTVQIIDAALPDTQVRALSWGGELVTPSNCVDHANLLACTNGAGAVYLALRCNGWAGKQNGMVIDAGGTTTAITPIIDGSIDPVAGSDPVGNLDHRARHGKLAWIGSRTTPLESLAHSIHVDGRQYPVVPRGVTMHEVMTIQNLLPAKREQRLRLFHAAPHRQRAIRAIADAIGVDPGIVPESKLLMLSAEFLELARQHLADALGRAALTAPKSMQHVLIFGLGARALVLPALTLAGVPTESVTLAEDLLSTELSDLASVYGAALAAMELAKNETLDAGFSLRPSP